jgi:hypothetical protein
MFEFEDQWDEKNIRSFLHRFKARMNNHSITEYAAFVNFLDGAFPSEVHEQAYYATIARNCGISSKSGTRTISFNWRQSVQLPQWAEAAVTRTSIAGDFEIASDRRSQMAARRPEKQYSDMNVSVEGEALTDVIASRQWKAQTAPPSAAHDWPGKYGRKSFVFPTDW